MIIEYKRGKENLVAEFLNQNLTTRVTSSPLMSGASLVGTNLD
jgi:hypothetical protein